MEDEKNKTNNEKDLKQENSNIVKNNSQNNNKLYNKNDNKEKTIKKSKCNFYRIFCFQMVICFFILTFLLIIRVIPNSNCLTIKQAVKTAIEGKNLESFFGDLQSYFTKGTNYFGFNKNDKEKEEQNNKNNKEERDAKDNISKETGINKNTKNAKENDMDANDIIVASEDEIVKLCSNHDEDDLTMFGKNNSACFNFKKPIKGEIASRYGLRENPFLKGKSDFHNGVDILARDGTPVVAIADGVVKTATKSNISGNYILIKHGDAYESLYAHCSKLLVSNGKTVKKGDKIALSGHTGKVTGPHLHLGIKKNGNWIDPMKVFVNFL